MFTRFMKLMALFFLFLTAFSHCSSPTQNTSDGNNTADSGTTKDSQGNGGNQIIDPGSGTKGPKCKTPLTQWEKMMFESHNKWRASVSPPAKNMYRLYWDTNIARNAAKWISNCNPKWPHSPEKERKGVGGYKILGENLSYCAGTGCTKFPEITDGSGKGDGVGWWNERKKYDWKTGKSKGLTAHYLHLASSNTYAIGCATKKCAGPGPGGWKGTWWWTNCQYGPRARAYWAGTKPYDAGKGGLVEPPDSVFTKHSGLCRP